MRQYIATMAEKGGSKSSAERLILNMYCEIVKGLILRQYIANMAKKEGSKSLAERLILNIMIFYADEVSKPEMEIKNLCWNSCDSHTPLDTKLVENS